MNCSVRGYCFFQDVGKHAHMLNIPSARLHRRLIEAIYGPVRRIGLRQEPDNFAPPREKHSDGTGGREQALLVSTLANEVLHPLALLGADKGGANGGAGGDDRHEDDGGRHEDDATMEDFFKVRGHIRSVRCT